MRAGWFGLAVMMMAAALASAAPSDPASFVQLYIHQLAQMDALKPHADVKRDPLAACTEPNARIAGTVQAQIAELQGLSFGPPFEKLVPNLVQTYRRKLTLYQQLQAACGSHAAPGVKDALSNIDYVNRNIVNSTPVVFGLLMDLCDGSGAASRQLAITRSQRAQLLRRIDIAFGKEIAAQDQDWTVVAASILRDALANQQFKPAEKR